MRKQNLNLYISVDYSEQNGGYYVNVYDCADDLANDDTDNALVSGQCDSRSIADAIEFSAAIYKDYLKNN